MAEKEESSPALSVPFNFGHLIAFVLPGIIGVSALSYVSPEILSLLKMLENGNQIAGSLILLGASSLMLGLIIDSFRGVVLDWVMHLYMSKVLPDIHKFTNPETRKLFDNVIENRYRFFQFKGNALIACLSWIVARYAFSSATLFDNRHDTALTIAGLIAVITLYISAQQSLKATYKDIANLNSTNQGRNQK